MGMTLLIGGARSGKTRTAERLATSSRLPVAYVATGWAGDEEMAARIARHQADRPSDWTTVETRRQVIEGLETVEASSFVILDCLTLWLSNILEDDEQTILDVADRTAAFLTARFAASVVITNEVGSGIVPADALTRRYRDLLGQVNGIFRARSDRAYLCVAGGVIPIHEFTS